MPRWKSVKDTWSYRKRRKRRTVKTTRNNNSSNDTNSTILDSTTESILHNGTRLTNKADEIQEKNSVRLEPIRPSSPLIASLGLLEAQKTCNDTNIKKEALGLSAGDNLPLIKLEVSDKSTRCTNEAVEIKKGISIPLEPKRQSNSLIASFGILEAQKPYNDTNIKKEVLSVSTGDNLPLIKLEVSEKSTRWTNEAVEIKKEISIPLEPLRPSSPLIASFGLLEAQKPYNDTIIKKEAFNEAAGDNLPLNQA